MLSKQITTATVTPCHRLLVTTTALICISLAAASASLADDLTKPIRVSSDGHFLMRPDGGAFFWLADTAWPIFQRTDRDEADHYLKDRAQKGFTVIQAVAWGGPWEGLSDSNRYGEMPLIDKDPSRPNPRYFEYIDWVVARASNYGLRMAILPTWGNNTVTLFTPSSAEAYGRWIGARYRDKGVIWILGGDMIPISPEDGVLIDHRPIYDAMAKGIRKGDGGHPLITYHPCGLSFSGAAQPRTSLYFHDREWLDMNMLQSSHFREPSVFFQNKFDFGWNAAFNYEPIAEEYRSTPVRPVIDGETRYEGEPIDVLFHSSKGYWTAYDSRNAAYHAVFSGAAGHTYGDNSVHQFYDPKHKPALESVKSPWYIELNAPGAHQMHHIKDLMLSRPYFTRVPDQSLILGPDGEGSEHISATRDKDGSYAMVYLPSAKPVSIDLSKIAGTEATAWWFDPRTGVTTRIKSAIPSTGAITFSPPLSDPEGDWVLVIDDQAKEFAAPGNAN